MWRVMLAVVVGLVVGGVVFFAFALYTWTAIHSGWSQRGMYIFLPRDVAGPDRRGRRGGVARVPRDCVRGKGR